MDSGRCLQTYRLHSEAVRAARWSPCGQRILSGGFDFALHLTDLETGVSHCTEAPSQSWQLGGLCCPEAALGRQGPQLHTASGLTSMSVFPGHLPGTMALHRGFKVGPLQAAGRTEPQGCLGPSCGAG